jgi:adenylyltransferase/sulfurtransferase
MLIKEFSNQGQETLSRSSVTVIGAGGLGSPVIYYLASAGIGNLQIADADKVEITNLNRQFLHFEVDLDKNKARSAKEKINQFNSDINVSVCETKIDDKNIGNIIQGSDIVLSCVDNAEARFIINKECVKQEIPMVDGGVGNFNGYVITVIPGTTPCYRCIFDSQAASKLGVFGAGAGVVGSLMATQAIKVLLGIKQGFEMLYIDLKYFEFQKIYANINPECPICGKQALRTFK